MFYVSEKEKIEDLTRTLKAIFGDGKKSDSGSKAQTTEKELKIPNGFTPIPAKKTNLIDLDSITSQEQINNLMRG